MFKFQFAFVLLLVILAVLGSDAYRQKARPVRLVQRHRKFSRQEAEPVTPYPTADELIPDIPFADGVPAEEPYVPEDFVPEGSEHFPDEVYGPPEVAVVYTPDEVYGPPELDENALPGEDFWAFQRIRKARLLQLRRKAAALKQAKLGKLNQLSKFAKLIKMAKLAKLGKLTLFKKKFA